MDTWVCALRTWDTCTSRANWLQQACGSSKAGINQLLWINFRCLTARSLNKLPFIGWVKWKAWNGSNTWFWWARIKTPMLRSTRPGFRSAAMRPRTWREAANTYKWCQMCLASAVTCKFSTGWMLISTSRKPVWIAWLVALLTFCFSRTRTSWRWLSVGIRCSLAELVTHSLYHSTAVPIWFVSF